MSSIILWPWLEFLLHLFHRNRRGVDCTATPIFGSSSYTSFTDAPSGCQCDNDITKIYLRHDSSHIRQLQVTAVTAAGSEIVYPGHGSINNNGAAELIEFAEGERLIGATGYYHSTVVMQITFFSITAEGTMHVYGPYGYLSPSSSVYTYFSVFGKINGFFGRSDTTYLRGIGFYYEGEGLYATRN